MFGVGDNIIIFFLFDSKVEPLKLCAKVKDEECSYLAGNLLISLAHG